MVEVTSVPVNLKKLIPDWEKQLEPEGFMSEPKYFDADEDTSDTK
jgi:hypothetical protein